jgi:transketolase N-terminal domain/subunit
MSSEVLKYFFSYVLSKIDRILLNSNKRYESENKEGTSWKAWQVASGKSVKKRKNRKYDAFGFTSTEVDGEERPQ